MTFPTYRHAFAGALLLCSMDIMAEAPQATDDVRTIPANTSVTINVLANDFDNDGDGLILESITQPAEGTARINPDGSVFYSARQGFTGTDSFTYILADTSNEGLTSTATVTITIEDGEFAAFAQSENDEGIGRLVTEICNALEGASDAALGAAQRQLLNQCLTLDTLAANNPEALEEALNQIAPEEVVAQMRVAVDSNRSQVKAVSQRVQQQRFASRGTNSRNAFALNGVNWSGQAARGAGASADEPSIWSKLGVFANLQIEGAERDKTDRENGYESETSGGTLGVDYFLNQSFLIGSTISFSENTLEYLNNDGELDVELTTLSAFGAYFYKNFSAYTQLGYGWIDFESQRNIRYGNDTIAINETTTSATNGTQKVINTRVEWDWQKDAWRVTPFARLDYLESDIKAYGELGSSGLAMIIGEQSASQLTLAGGIQSAYTFTPSWGVLIPTLSLTYLSETSSDRDPVSVRFAADIDSTRTYSLVNDGSDTGFYQASLGSSAVFKHGFSGFAEYTQTFGYEYLSAWQFQMGVRYEL